MICSIVRSLPPFLLSSVFPFTMCLLGKMLILSSELGLASPCGAHPFVSGAPPCNRHNASQEQQARSTITQFIEAIHADSDVNAVSWTGDTQQSLQLDDQLPV